MKDAKVIDATNAPVGRLASRVAKRLLGGEKIVIINADNAIITGNQKATKDKYAERRARGSPHHGPFFPTKSDALLRRAVRGMLPFKKASGRTAFRNLHVHADAGGFESESAEKMPAQIKSRYITLRKLSTELRGV